MGIKRHRPEEIVTKLLPRLWSSPAIGSELKVIWEMSGYSTYRHFVVFKGNPKCDLNRITFQLS
jgi:hypothetical protein